MASKAFQDALKFTLEYEGGYVNNPNDPGGATNFGITQNTYDGYRVTQRLDKQSVRQISRAEVQEIYYRSFWLKISGDSFHPAVASCIFDFVVNSGFSNKWDTGGMQLIQHEFELQDDGKCGPQTIATISAVNPEEACNRINDVREENYRRLGRNPSQAIFLKGWLSRVLALRLFIKNLL